VNHAALPQAAPIVLLLLAASAAVVTVANKTRADVGGGGQNIFLALVALWAAVRAVQATLS
jgi:hypothetical protein